MTALRGNIVGLELCKALGIGSENVYKVKIVCPANGIAEVRIFRYLQDNEKKQIIDMLSRYGLKHLEDKVLDKA